MQSESDDKHVHQCKYQKQYLNLVCVVGLSGWFQTRNPLSGMLLTFDVLLLQGQNNVIDLKIPDAPCV